MDLRKARNAVGISQSRLARLSGVSRFKICMFELGDGTLMDDESDRLRKALQSEVDRLRELPDLAGFAAFHAGGDHAV